MRILIIANPVAGGGLGRVRADALHALLREGGAETELLVTGKAGDAQTMAAAAHDWDCIAVIGGDGTVNEVINGLAHDRQTIAVLPAGSANVVAREFAIPSDAAEVARWILEGRSRPMDLLESAGHKIILGAGAGLDAAIATTVKQQRGAKSSVYHWILPGIRTVLAYTYPGVRVTVDGTEICAHSPYVIIGNCRYSAGVFPATRRAVVDDGLLDVVAVKKLSAWRLPVLLGAVWSPRFPEREDVVYVQGKEACIEPVDPVPVALQIDGDPAGFAPARFTVLPQAIRIVTPDAPAAR